MKTMKKLDFKILPKTGITLLVCFISTFGCNDDFLAEGNPSSPSVTTSFNNEAEAESAVFGIYAALQGNDTWARFYWWIPDMLSDECQTAGPQLVSFLNDMLNYNIDSSSRLISSVWRGLYRIIHRANFVIYTLPDKENPELPAETIEKLVAEAKFLRALCYFELVTYWGAVPFPTEPVTGADGVPMAESEEAIYNLILEDLAAAEAGLPSVSDYRGTSNLGRATKGAAQALAGKVEYYRGNYQAAKIHLDKVIASGNYDLTPTYEENHQEENENNIESIFEVQFGLYESGNQGWSNSGDGGKIEQLRSHEYSPHVWHNTIPSEILKAAFEDDDPRYKASFIEYGDTYGANNEAVFDASKVAQGITEIPTHWKKYGYEYKNTSPGLFSGINLRVVRYADVLLMMAEIETEINGPSAVALNYLNSTRTRVGMPNYPTAEYPTDTKEQMIAAIIHERQVELNSEQIRARDVKRWFREGKIGQPHPNYEPKHEFLPIPIDEIDNNAAIDDTDQKPGY
ncbi:RagB/SusD family nutrient uptake outer membrane protein [Maribacter sp. 2210JD10-5]|uniref:RagB/SusD family nutrient uptake outer membrane protein n=1 Tax=Maribacter sp. 2210JD10-5 TaxID=3386272 RepID=UPI0039BD4D66